MISTPFFPTILIKYKPSGIAPQFIIFELGRLMFFCSYIILASAELENNFINLNSENPTWKKIEPLK